VRIGAVNYLNSKPLIEGLAELAPSADLFLDFPSRLADRLSAGALDVALIPSIEYLRNPQYEVVSDACVATRGPVLSVKLFFRVPPQDVRRLALDAGSRSSATLARILLAERFGVEPELEELRLGDSADQPPDRPTAPAGSARRADAVLMIGDRAMHPPREDFAATWDLGEEWLNWTGLPFVFALWAARCGGDLGIVEEALNRARDLGVERLPEIARREAGAVGIPERTAFDYLSRNLHFFLGSAERSGLRLFYQLAAKLGLAPKGLDIAFRHCAPAR
jgi:chorismate dehydratase